MKLDEKPLSTLKDIASASGTGEFICASAGAEVHVFLQRGRVAWATDSQHPFAFTRHLQQVADIDPDSFRDILDSCRREKRPLGETLVSWGVATWDDVRAALRHQIGLALELLARGGAAQTLFLDRTTQFAQYDSGLTFELEGLLPGPPVAPSPPAPPAGEAAPLHAPRADLARRLFELVEGVVWAEVLDGTSVLEAMPSLEPPGAPAPSGRFEGEIVRRTVLDLAELVAIRTPEGTLAGVGLDAPRSLWCRLTPDATVGAALSALSAYGAQERTTGELGPPMSRGTPWVIGEDAAVATTELVDFLGRAPETLAALITDMADGPWSCGAGSGLPPEYAIDLVRRRGRALATPRLFQEPERPDLGADVGFRFRSMLTRERRVWCFGAEIGVTRRHIVWLLLDRRSSQGLGWAYLTSLSRQLLHLRGWEAHG